MWINKKPGTGVSPTNKTPDEEVEAIREEYRRGEPVASIAVRSGVTNDMVRKFCADIEPPVKQPPLSDTEINSLLAGWPAP